MRLCEKSSFPRLDECRITLSSSRSDCICGNGVRAKRGANGVTTGREWGIRNEGRSKSEMLMPILLEGKDEKI